MAVVALMAGREGAISLHSLSDDPDVERASGFFSCFLV